MEVSRSADRTTFGPTLVAFHKMILEGFIVAHPDLDPDCAYASGSSLIGFECPASFRRGFPVQLAGADHLRPQFIGIPTGVADELEQRGATDRELMDKICRTLEVDLFRDGSPYVREYDDAQPACAQGGSRYHIIVTPDSPPCMIHEGYLLAEHSYDGEEAQMRDLDGVPKRYGRESVHWLTDAECASVGACLLRPELRIDDLLPVSIRERMEGL